MTFQPKNKHQFRLNTILALIAVASFSLATYFYHQLSKPLEVTVTTGPIGQNRTLKDRMIFVVNLEKTFRKRGWIASFDLEGENGKTLILFLEKMNRHLAREMVGNKEIISEIRDMGFKRLIMRNGKEEWNVDLKN